MVDSKAHILVIDDKVDLLKVFKKRLEFMGYRVSVASSGQEGVALFRQGGIDVVLTDLQMPDLNGEGVVREVKALDSAAVVLIITAYPTVASSLEALRLGAEEYFPKPINFEHLQLVVERAMERRRLQRERDEVLRASGRRSSCGELLGESPAMNEVYRQIDLAAAGDCTVLLWGETGTGKELAARAIHGLSPRRGKPFVAVNCGSMPESLLESELFGHVKGAFTGAQGDKKGLFAAAEGGTILLDEIEAAPARTQVALLRVIDRKEVMPVGSTAAVAVDVRVVATSNADLEAMVAAGTFRKDLFYRIIGMVIKMSPLRKRPEDIPQLVEAFRKGAQKPGEPEVGRFSPASMALLARQPWPGNVRELRNLVARLAVEHAGMAIGPGDMPPEMRKVEVRAEDFRTLAQLEKEQLVRALESSGKNKAAAARLLGISRGTLYSLMEKHGISLPDEASKA